MTDATMIADRQDAARPASARGSLSLFFHRVCEEIGADRYMLVEPSPEGGSRSVRIVASNWIFDALEDLGSAGIASIVESGHSSVPGAAPRALALSGTPVLSADEKRALLAHGTAEIYCLKLALPGGTFFVIFSSSTTRAIDAAALPRIQMKCIYALSRHPVANRGRGEPGPLSERERECLLWVSEGKTTDEVAVILGVSSNTVNSYVAHAIQKFGASNRAMAIATAIRSGII